MEIDKEMEREAAKRGCRLTVKLNNGKSYVQKVEYCKGLAENPLTRRVRWKIPRAGIGHRGQGHH